jgi:PEP-CTERM motif
MRHAFRITAAAAAVSVVALAAPASAELVIYIDISGHVDTFSTAADSLVLGTFTLDGVTIAGELATATQSSSAGGDLLDNSVLSVINHTGATRSVEIVVSETGFAGPVDSYEAGGSGTWENNVGRTITFNWYVDSANVQGGIGGATPGTLVTSFSNTATSRLEGFTNGTADGGYIATGPVSMTEEATYTLKPHGELLNRGMVESLTVVPEPSTWAMMVLGFMGLAYAAVRRGRKERSAVAL